MKITLYKTMQTFAISHFVLYCTIGTTNMSKTCFYSDLLIDEPSNKFLNHEWFHFAK